MIEEASFFTQKRILDSAVCCLLATTIPAMPSKLDGKNMNDDLFYCIKVYMFPSADFEMHDCLMKTLNVCMYECFTCSSPRTLKYMIVT